MNEYFEFDFNAVDGRVRRVSTEPAKDFFKKRPVQLYCEE